jgi:hypothetical protein
MASPPAAAEPLVNPLKGETTFTVKGAAYVVFFDIDRVCQLEDLVRRREPDLDGIRDIVARMNRTKRVGLIRATLWVGLQQHQPKVTEAEAGVLIGRLTIAGALFAINAAMAAAFPGDADEEEEAEGGSPAPAPSDPPAPPAGGTG